MRRCGRWNAGQAPLLPASVKIHALECHRTKQCPPGIYDNYAKIQPCKETNPLYYPPLQSAADYTGTSRIALKCFLKDDRALASLFVRFGPYTSHILLQLA